MKVLVDEHVPLLDALFGGLGEVIPIPGSGIDPEALRGVEALVIRSVTRVDRALLEGSQVRFVGSATAGTDHIDTEYLEQAGIGFSHAPGSNADSVVDYTVAVLLAMAEERACDLRGKRLGVVGAGAVGSRLVRRARALGMNVMCCDPPRVAAGLVDDGATQGSFVDLHTLLDGSDVVSLHVPLTTTGPYATHGMMGAVEFSRLSREAWFINTARGAVVDDEALIRFRDAAPDAMCCLDVWNGEPAPSPEVMRRVRFGTPHIAGYAWDAKVEGAVAVARSLAAHAGRDEPPVALLPRERVLLRLEEDGSDSTTRAVEAVVERLYDFSGDFDRFDAVRAADEERRGQVFAALRKEYPMRRSFAAWDVVVDRSPSEPLRCALEVGLGVRLVVQGS